VPNGTFRFRYRTRYFTDSGIIGTKEKRGDRYLLLFGHRVTPMNTDYETFYGDDSMFASGWIPSLREKLSNLSEFVKEIKQSFSRYYNKRLYIEELPIQMRSNLEW